MKLAEDTKKNADDIINIMKILLYKEDPQILEKVDFDNDSIFLDPLLFAYFNSKKKNGFPKETLNEIIQGHYINKEPLSINHSYNKNKIAYIPNLGYFEKDSTTMLEPLLKVDEFEIIKDPHPLLDSYFIEYYKGHILDQNPKHNPNWKSYYQELEKAITIIKENIPDFYSELIFANKNIYLHDNPKILNFTSVETLGMLYFYVIGSNNLLYFIEELIHQGAHNYLYYAVHNRKEYFKIDVDNLIMRDLTKQAWDYRDVYGAFHGLYTVTKRVECYDQLLSKKVFSGREKHELLGRLTDQFSRFRTGLELLNLEEVYTEKGIALYHELDKKCASLLEKYKKLKTEFDLSNRDLDFRYDDFCTLNNYEIFLENDAKNHYQF